MKKVYYLALAAVVGIALSSCSLLGGGGSKTPSFNLSDLQALWQENNTEHFVRFTTERSDEYPYFLGREWNEDEWEDEGSYEDFLIEQREKQGFPGNGWFKYEFKTAGDLTEIHLTDNGGAEIPKVYIVSTLKDGELSYYEKDRPSNKFTFTKVVSAK
ncbi:MAG: hypothetical protein J6W89_05855 [Paludibacteraceae bacterium]|nr:hypothetical protein [Paludibacteraceae bacterium]